MQLPRRSLLLAVTLLLFLTTEVGAQDIYIDSIQKLMAKPTIPADDKAILLCKLARANFEKNLQTSINQANEAIRITQNMADGRGKAFAYATLIHLNVRKKDMLQAYKSRDSAIFYADRTKDTITKGYVSFRNGWLDMINDENDKAISKLLKALNFFNGQNAYEYESNAYHYIASFYGYGNDAVKQAKYARLCYTTAVESKQVDMLNTAYYTLGQSYFDRFKMDTTRRALLDSALAFNKKALDLSARQSGRLLVKSNTAAAALNTANTYFQYFPNSYKDSAEKYINIAVDIANKTNLKEVLLNCYGLRSEYALREGNYAAAEQMLLKGLSEIEGDIIKMPVTQARMFLGLSHIAEKKGDHTAALNYLKRYIQFNKEAFDEEKLSSIQKIDAQYQSEKKEQEIAQLQQQASFTRKRNIFYIILGAAGIAILLSLLSSYNYKLKASIRKQELVDKEKQEAELRAQLKETEAIRLQTEQVLLKERQERLEKELLAGSLQIEEKNELLELLSGKVTTDSHLSVDEQIKRIITQQKRMDKDFEDHKTDFFEISPAFFERLQQKANNTLTRLDLKYCSYIFMGMSNKEISVRLNVEPKSIRMARYRIKQKFGLEKHENLDNFIRSHE